MKKLLLLAFGVLIALPSLLIAQNEIPAERKFAIIEIFDNDANIDSFKIKKLYTSVKTITDGSVTYQNAPGDSAVLYLSADPARSLKGTVTWKWADQRFDTTYVEKERVDDPAGAATRWTITNLFKAVNTPKPGVYNKTFSAVQVTSTASSASFTFTGDRIEFFGERFEGHGLVKVFVDGQQVQTLSQGNVPWVTDFSRMQPSFFYNFPKKPNFNSPATQHTIEFKTDPANQYIIDMVRVMNYTLTPR